MTLFDRVKQLCKENNVTQGQMEKDINISNGASSKWKISQPNSETLQKLADYFNVSTDFLLTGIHSSKSEKNPFHDLKGIYLSYAKEAQDNGIDPDDIRLALDTIKKLRGNK